MIDERHEELASLYALDLLEGAELAAFESRLVADPALRALVRDLRDTMASLAFTAPAAPPPAGLKVRLLAQISAPAAGAASSTVVRLNFAAWFGLAAAACFAVATAFLAKELLTTRQDAVSLRAELALADITRRDAELQLKSEHIILTRQVALAEQELKAQGDLAHLRIAALTNMLGNSSQALAVAVWNPSRQEGVFTVDRLPAADKDSDYELWVIDPKQPKPISGGVFTVRDDGSTRIQFKTEAPVTAIAKFAVSREKKGGAPKLSGPQGAVIMISQ